jgi:hypothetical protein
LEEIFLLKYYGHLDESYIVSLQPWERRWFLNRLVKQKEQEAPKKSSKYEKYFK